ncbi:hypothetical protein VTH06DRAFT_8085, partial [Thermothelomyces fergusii]
VLDAQVRKLSDRLNTLSTTVFAMVRTPQQPSAAESRSQEQLLLTPRSTITATAPPLPRGPLSVFESDDDDDENDDYEGREGTGLPYPNGRGKTADAGGPTRSPRDEEEEGEEEEPTPVVVRYGAFGEELRADDDDEDEDEQKRRKAARTLSLSQLTMGRAQRARV